LWLLCVV